MVEKCICGHMETFHKIHSIIPYCKVCQLEIMYDRGNVKRLGSHTFKLDNLKLIEDLAKERGLND